MLLISLLAVNAYAIPVDLGTASSFGVLAGSAITNTGSSVVNGDVGIFPGPAVTGFGPGVINGTLHISDDAAQQAQSDLTAAYNAAAGATPTMILTGTDLGFYNSVNPLSPGVYFFSSSAGLTGNLTLDAQGDSDAQWIFQIGSTLITAPNSSMAFINGATKCNVFWQVGSSATIQTNNVFAGNIMALESITLNGGILNGRALARNGAVTISSAETVNAGSCEVPEASSVALGIMSIPFAAAWFRRKK
jgi:hypothetical protein